MNTAAPSARYRPEPLSSGDSTPATIAFITRLVNACSDEAEPRWRGYMSSTASVRIGNTSAMPNEPIIIGNTSPKVTLTTTPAPGQPFSFGQQVSYTVTVEDDTPVDCTKVSVAYILGHDDHGHPLTASAGCTGTITTSASGHEGLPNIRAVFNASYTDAPTDPDVPPLTASDEVVLTPNP